MAQFSIDEFIQEIGDYGGLKYTDKYEFRLDIDGKILNTKTQNHLMLMCKNINYPNFVFAQSTTNGLVLGRTDTPYPTHNINNDLEATFLVGEKAMTLVAFQGWYHKIRPGKKIGKDSGVGHRRFNYPEEWKTTASLKLLDKTQRANAEIIFYDVYPFNNDVIPMAYDRVAPMEITVRFAYSDFTLVEPRRDPIRFLPKGFIGPR